MDHRAYEQMMKILYFGPLYAFYKGNRRDIDTLKAGEIFLAYADNFNDRFEGLIEIDYTEFAEECLRLRVGDGLFNEIVNKLKFSKDLNVVDSLSLYRPQPILPNSKSRPVSTEMPVGVSEDLKKFILQFNYDKFRQEIKDKYLAYQAAILKVRNSFGIKCFTLSSPLNNSVMWSHYGNDYKGICCAFFLQKTVYDIPSARCDLYGKFICEHIKPIEYVDNFNPNIKLNCKKLLRIPLKNISTSKYIIMCVQKSLLIKQDQWEHENEVRLIIRNNEDNANILEKNEKGFKIKFPYLGTVYTCNRTSIFNWFSSETNVQRAAKSLARKMNIECFNLVPSSSKKEFIKERYNLDRRKRYDTEDPPLIDYSNIDLPF